MLSMAQELSLISIRWFIYASAKLHCPLNTAIENELRFWWIVCEPVVMIYYIISNERP